MRRLVLLLLFTVAANTATAATVPTGQFDYRLAWNGIPAGSATISVSSSERAGQSVYAVNAVARTSWLVDLLWSLRAHAESTFTATELAPLGFRYDREVNAERNITDVTFNPAAAEATGTRYRANGSAVVVDVHERVLDPITAIFRALAEPLYVGDTLQYEIFTGEARYRVQLVIIGEDVLSVAAGSFRAWRIEPHVWKLGTGADTRLRHATLWVSEGPERMLLRIRSEVFIGAVNCDLLPRQSS
jgi:hypothetical protein